MTTFWAVMAVVMAGSAVILALTHDSLALAAFVMTIVCLFKREAAR